MNYFNKSIIIGLFGVIMLQSSLSYCMEDKFIVDEATFNELNELFQREQLTDIFQYIPSAMNAYLGRHESESTFRSGSEKDSELMAAINLGLVDKVKSLIEQGADVNLKANWGHHHTPLSHAIGSAIEREKFALHESPVAKETALKIVELLIQDGAKINEIVYGNNTALELALSSEKPGLEIIRLLLGYGANVTEKAIRLALTSSNAKELMQIFDIHLRLLKQVKSNPTGELLRLTIRFNKPYVVQLIVDKKPELVMLSDIELAKETSPASVLILSKALKLAKFKELATKKNVPVELTRYIEKLVG